MIASYLYENWIYRCVLVGYCRRIFVFIKQIRHRKSFVIISRGSYICLNRFRNNLARVVDVCLVYKERVDSAQPSVLLGSSITSYLYTSSYGFSFEIEISPYKPLRSLKDPIVH